MFSLCTSHSTRYHSKSLPFPLQSPKDRRKEGGLKYLASVLVSLSGTPVINKPCRSQQIEQSCILARFPEVKVITRTGALLREGHITQEEYFDLLYSVVHELFTVIFITIYVFSSSVLVVFRISMSSNSAPRGKGVHRLLRN